MSIDKINVVTGDGCATEHEFKAISHEQAQELRKTSPEKFLHTIYEMRGGVEHLYLFDSPAEAVSTFETWRRTPCERITLKLYGQVFENEGRLPLEEL